MAGPAVDEARDMEVEGDIGDGEGGGELVLWMSCVSCIAWRSLLSCCRYGSNIEDNLAMSSLAASFSKYLLLRQRFSRVPINGLVKSEDTVHEPGTKSDSFLPACHLKPKITMQRIKTIRILEKNTTQSAP